MSEKKQKVTVEIDRKVWDLFKKTTRVNHSNGTSMINIMIDKYNQDHIGDLQGKFEFKEES